MAPVLVYVGQLMSPSRAKRECLRECMMEATVYDHLYECINVAYTAGLAMLPWVGVTFGLLACRFVYNKS